jgi:SAM-dependent methyltransferase
VEPDPKPYVHGRSERESERLRYQASGLAAFLHRGTRYPPGSRVLEAGCGVGAQTVILLENSPGAECTCVDISPESLASAKARVKAAGFSNVAFRRADIYNLPFLPGSFDHVFVCFLLEHLPDPVLALKKSRDVIRPGGTITAIEGDHGSALFYPQSRDAQAVIGCLVDIQREMGGNSLIGRELPHLFREAGFTRIRVSPRPVFADGNVPQASEAVKNIFIAMIEGVKDEALARGKIDNKTWERGIRDLYRTTEPGGSFCYTFFKAVGVRGRR